MVEIFSHPRKQFFIKENFQEKNQLKVQEKFTCPKKKFLRFLRFFFLSSWRLFFLLRGRERFSWEKSKILLRRKLFSPVHWFSAIKTLFSLKSQISKWHEYLHSSRSLSAYYAILNKQSLNYFGKVHPLRLSWKFGGEMSFSVIRTPGYSN